MAFRIFLNKGTFDYLFYTKRKKFPEGTAENE
jgi:hypothetical protein